MIELNYKKVKFTMFPNEESMLHLKDLTIQKHNHINLFFVDNNDLIHLMFLKHHINSMNATAELFINYMPYSRMDRSNSDYSFSLSAVADFINGLNFSKVTVREPHSKVT